MADQGLGTLLTQARGGNRQALDRFVHLTQDRVFRYALVQLRDADLAADVTQETFTRMLTRLDRWHARVDPTAWLLRFACNVVRETRRRQMRRPRREAAVNRAPPGPAQACIEADQHQRLWRAIEKLPAR